MAEILRAGIPRETKKALWPADFEAREGRPRAKRPPKGRAAKRAWRGSLAYVRLWGRYQLHGDEGSGVYQTVYGEVGPMWTLGDECSVHEDFVPTPEELMLG